MKTINVYWPKNFLTSNTKEEEKLIQVTEEKLEDKLEELGTSQVLCEIKDVESCPVYSDEISEIISETMEKIHNNPEWYSID